MSSLCSSINRWRGGRRIDVDKKISRVTFTCERKVLAEGRVLKMEVGGRREPGREETERQDQEIV